MEENQECITPPSALEVNIACTRVNVTIDPKYEILLRLMDKYLGAFDGLKNLLREVCHPYKNWAFILKGARNYSLNYFHVLKNNPQGPDGARTYFDIFFEAVRDAKERSIQTEAADDILLFFLKILKEADIKPKGFLPLLHDCLRQIAQCDDDVFSLFATSFYQMNRLGELLLNATSSHELLETMAQVLDRYYRYTYNYWLAQEDEVDRERVAMAVELYKLLYQKYHLSFTDMERHLPQLQASGLPELRRLKEALLEKNPRQKIFKLLSYFEKLKGLILSPEAFDVREDIYRKRHFTVDIPSMYGSYHELKFDALGLSFRIESLLNILFEEMVEEIEPDLITRAAFSRILDSLRLFNWALNLDGIVSREMERHLDLLAHAIEIRGFSSTQYLDIFRGLSQSLSNIVNDYFNNIHQGNLFKIVPEYSDRKIMGISDDWGTAVTVQQMVFGNFSPSAGSGVFFTHNPRWSGDMLMPWGDFTSGNQGEDVVSGLVRTHPISVRQAENENRDPESSLEILFPSIYHSLREWSKELVYQHRWSPQEMEFTFEGPREGDLYFLQTRDMGMRERKMESSFDHGSGPPPPVLGHGIGVSGGAMSGRIVFSIEEINKWRKDEPGTSLILLRNDTVPDDIREIYEADGLLTARGGSTSHAAIVAHRLGKTCVVGCSRLTCVERDRTCTIGGRKLGTGDHISIDGREGSIYLGKLRIREREEG